MINFSFNPASLVGIVVALAGAALYALRSFRPELARDHDLFFAALAVLYGFVLLFYSWKYDPLMQFAEIIVGGSAIFFAFENIRMRGITTEQAKRSGPIVDDERPVSRVYRAELDELNPMEERPATRRIPGSRDSRSPRSDDYGGEGRRRSTRRRPSSDGSGPGDRPRRRRPRSDSRSSVLSEDGGRRSSYRSDDYWDDDRDLRDESGDRPASRSNRSRSRNRSAESGFDRSRRRRPPEDAPPRQGPTSEEDSDYVDYQPVDYPDVEGEDNSDDFDY